MATHREPLPQLNGQRILTDGGMETDLLFNKQIDLPHFCSFPLVVEEHGRAAILAYLDEYLAVARRYELPLLLESATWRASPDWIARLGYRADQLTDFNRQSIDLLAECRGANPDVSTIISACMGPRGDGYVPNTAMTAEQAEEYHSPQAQALAASQADLISALTLNYAEEAIGIARAAHVANMPCAISFTVETDGRLPTGQPLSDAVRQVDKATNGSPAYYMINCAHPTHFDAVLNDAPWTRRLLGVRANASTLSHAELDQCETLDTGDPDDLGQRIGSLADRMKHLTVLGGCCGTDSRHLAAIAAALAS